jgi:hypothetical protein
METVINKKEMRNDYMDLSISLYDCQTLVEFYKILPLTLPFLAKYSSEFLTTCLIEDVKITELRLNK